MTLSGVSIGNLNTGNMQSPFIQIMLTLPGEALRSYEMGNPGLKGYVCVLFLNSKEAGRTHLFDIEFSHDLGAATWCPGNIE